MPVCCILRCNGALILRPSCACCGALVTVVATFSTGPGKFILMFTVLNGDNNVRTSGRVLLNKQSKEVVRFAARLVRDSWGGDIVFIQEIVTDDCASGTCCAGSSVLLRVVEKGTRVVAH